MQSRVEYRGQSPGRRFFGTESGVTAQFGPQSSSLVSVDPNEEPRVRLGRRAIGDSVGPVLRETVILGCGCQTSVRHRELHRDVRTIAAHVIAPQRRHRLLHATFACKRKIDKL